MSSFQVGEVYLVKFHPGTGKELKKYRPAIIVNNKINQLDARFTLISPLTTRPKQNQYEVTLSEYAFLEKKSTLLGWYVWTIDVKRLIKKLGSVSINDLNKIEKSQRNLFS